MTDTMKIWDAVAKTNPNHTKHVSQRGGFTSINAHSQVMEATRQFGPIGIGWGYVAGDPTFHDNLMFVPVTLWHGERSNTFGPMLGCEEWKDSKGRVDSDVGKKATTDAVTKLLSQLGFNADVFLGLWDDNKYVEQRRQEVAAETEPRITDEQRDELIQLLDHLNVPVAEVLNIGKLKDLRELQAARFEGVKKWINDRAIELRDEKKAA